MQHPGSQQAIINQNCIGAYQSSSFATNLSELKESNQQLRPDIIEGLNIRNFLNPPTVTCKECEATCDEKNPRDNELYKKCVKNECNLKLNCNIPLSDSN